MQTRSANVVQRQIVNSAGKIFVFADCGRRTSGQSGHVRMHLSECDTHYDVNILAILIYANAFRRDLYAS